MMKTNPIIKSDNSVEKNLTGLHITLGSILRPEFKLLTSAENRHLWWVGGMLFSFVRFKSIKFIFSMFETTVCLGLRAALSPVIGTYRKQAKSMRCRRRMDLTCTTIYSLKNDELRWTVPETIIESIKNRSNQKYFIDHDDTKIAITRLV